MTTPAPWERQDYDTDESWPVFQSYRDSYPRKTFVDSYNGMPISPIKVQGWMLAHFWKLRAEAWDKHLDTARRDTQEAMLRQRVEEVTAEHMEITALGRKVARKELEKLLAQVEQGGYNALKPEALIRMLDTMVKLDRLIRDKSTENVGGHIDFSKASNSELDDLETRLKAVLER